MMRPAALCPSVPLGWGSERARAALPVQERTCPELRARLRLETDWQDAAGWEAAEKQVCQG